MAASLLHSAVQEGNKEIVVELLKNGQDVNSRDEYGRTPLHVACGFPAHRESNVSSPLDFAEEMISLLLEYGANIEAKLTLTQREELTPMALAIKLGYHDVVRILSDKGADINERVETNLHGDMGTLLHLACELQSSSAKLINQLLDNGLEIEAKTSLYLATPLHLAASCGNEETVNALLARGADVNSRSVSENGPLMRTISYAYPRIAEILLEHGADANTAGINGMRPLHEAANMGEIATAKLLIKCGASVNARADDNATALHFACGYRNEDERYLEAEMVAILLDIGADVEARTTYNGLTPLHCAVEQPNTEIIKILISRKTNVNARSGDGDDTPLLLACLAGNPSHIKALIEGGADIHGCNSMGQTPLHLAALVRMPDYGYRATHIESIESIEYLLLHHDLDINCQDAEGNTPLRIALNEETSYEMVEFLVDLGADADILANHLVSDVDTTSRFHIKVLEMSQLHVAKIRLAGFRVSQQSTRLVMDRESSVRCEEPASSGCWSFTSYGQECMSEIAKEFASITGLINRESSVSLYEILTTKNPGYTMNTSLMEVLLSVDCDKFPHYGRMISYKIRIDQKRSKLIGPAGEAFDELCQGRGRILPGLLVREISEKIVSHLNLFELRKLISNQ